MTQVIEKEMSEFKREVWAPYYAALEQIADVVATLPIETVLEHDLLWMPPIPLTWDFFRLLQQRHPPEAETFYRTYEVRRRAAAIAQHEQKTRETAAKRKATIARKKAEAATRAAGAMSDG